MTAKAILEALSLAVLHCGLKLLPRNYYAVNDNKHTIPINNVAYLHGIMRS